MQRQRLRFPGASGQELVGRLETPDGEPKAYALFVHCFTCSKDLKAAGWISGSLVDRGIAVLRFDLTGIGESSGDFADTDFHTNLDDLMAAADFLREKFEAPKLLIGHSLGGSAVIAGAERVPEAMAVATIGAPSDTAHLQKTLARRAPELEEGEDAEISLGLGKFRVKRQFFEDLAEDHLSAALANLGKALIVFHSPVDEIVNVDHARRIYQGARHPKSFVSLDDADHLLSREADGRYVGEVLAAWAGRYLGGEAGTVSEAPEEAGVEGKVVVEGGPSGYAQTIRSGRHLLHGDEPVSVGGDDTGPTPYDFLLAALGTCTSMTLRMYADRKKWPLEGVKVALAHSKIHAKDCLDCTTKTGRIDRIERVIEVAGPLDQAQRDRLLEIADRCPVHRTLQGEISIRSTLT